MLTKAQQKQKSKWTGWGYNFCTVPPKEVEAGAGDLVLRSELQNLISWVVIGRDGKRRGTHTEFLR